MARRVRQEGVKNKKTGDGYISEAMACHPDQVKEFNEFYKRNGVQGAEHLPNGDLHITSRKNGRNQVMKLRGMVDKDGGYGDYTGS